jgi:hypothetical protein
MVLSCALSEDLRKADQDISGISCYGIDDSRHGENQTPNYIDLMSHPYIGVPLQVY